MEIKNETTRIYQSGWCCCRRYDNNNIVFGRELFRGSLLSDKKPNIFFILADDLGIGEVSYYGEDNYKTPNIDKLANRGTVFMQSYCQQAVLLMMEMELEDMPIRKKRK